MVRKVLLVVDGSLPSRGTAALVDGLLPKAAEVVSVQVVPQLPCAWAAWPAFSDPGEDLAKASAYVGEVSAELKSRGWNVGTKVHFSVLSAAEMDQEILTLADAMGADLICLALEGGRVTDRIIRDAVVPVLVAKRSTHRANPQRLRVETRERLEAAHMRRPLLLHPVAALIFRYAGIL